MGNCIEVRKPNSWVDEEDASVEPQADEEAEANVQADSDRKEAGSGSGGGSAEIKIKISKRQVEKLLRRVDGERISLRQALADLAISSGESTWEMVGSRREAKGRHWRPELQSIPEEAE